MTARERIVRGYGSLCNDGRIALDQVPAKYREEVIAILHKVGGEASAAAE